jgi:hypothetical protein
MKYHISLIIKFFAISFIISSCTKNDMPVIEDPSVTRDIQINSLSNILILDDGFLVTGVSNSKIFISKLDVNFNTIWEKNNYEWGTLKYSGGWGMGSSYNVDIRKVFINNHGTITCFCTKSEGGDVIMISDFIVKIDKNGNQILGIEIPNSNFIDVAETSDNGYLLAGANLVKLNSYLLKSWETPVQNNDFVAIKLINTNDKGFALTGTWRSDQVLFQKLDDKGNIQSTNKSFNQKHFNDHGYDLCQLSDNGFLIIGRTRDLIPPYDMNCFIIRTDMSGDTLWTKKFGDEYNEWLEKFLYTSNDDFIIQETVGYNNDPIRKTILLRMSLEGQIIDSKETTPFEIMVYSNSGYFVRVDKSGDNTHIFSKVQIDDLFSK